MKTLLVTSRVTFVPANYDAFVAGMAACEHIGGLLILDNRDLRLVKQALGLCLVGAARIGWRLLANMNGASDQRRADAYAAVGKPVWRLPTIHGAPAVALVRDHGFDLILNARTRFIYREEILRTPRLGCLNIHHGLLPDQRGVLCDLWALTERRPAGFSIHVMASKIDAGAILARVQVSDGSHRDYPAYLLESSRREVVEATALLARLERDDRLDGAPNVAPPGLRHCRNPTPAQVREMRRKGILL